ncbi:MAG: type II toxin-antitoxin system VapC family toxin [bacterium]|nr:type II toxin-antitoxin system VapC family toxin [bacterium]
MNVFLDTSAAIKLYHKEVGSDELLAFLNAQAHDLILTISDITHTEFHSAFLRRVRMQEIPATPVFAVFGLFDRDLMMFNQIVVDDTVKRMATTLLDNIAHQRGLRTLDAFQLAAALFCHQIVPVGKFVTADEKLGKIAKDFFTVYNPEDNAATP